MQLRRKLSFWRGATFVAGALAAGLAAVAVVDRLQLPSPPGGGRYVAVVDTGGREPALIAEVDTTTGTIRVRSLAAETPQGRSLELWHIPEGQQPRSLGVLKAGLNAKTVKELAGPVDGILAVSVEPEGGSPSGAPTGPVVYTGKLVRGGVEGAALLLTSTRQLGLLACALVHGAARQRSKRSLVEPRGIEPLTSALRMHVGPSFPR